MREEKADGDKLSTKKFTQVHHEKLNRYRDARNSYTQCGA
jgi:hypothetical protein